MAGNRGNRRNRRATSQYAGHSGVFATAVSTVATLKWRLTFDQPVVMNAVPTGFLKAGVAPTAATVVSSTVIDLTFAANAASGQAFTISGTDPSIRTRSGGLVAAAAGTFP